MNGIILGSVYALIALGYSMVYGILKLLNFAHGDVYMIGAFIGFGVLTLLGGPLNPAIPVALLVLCMFVVAMLGSGFLGLAIERFAYRPLRDAPRIAPLISALGVAFFLENSALLLFGSQFRDYDGFDLISYNGIHLGGDNGVFIQYLGVIVIVGAVFLMVALIALVRWTRLGKAMRAVSFDREAAAMMGIDTDRVIAATFFIGSALAGAAGVMFGLLFSQIYHLMGFLAGLKGFTAAVVGGIGSIPGAMLGGLLVGLVESWAKRLPERQRLRPGRLRDPDRRHAAAAERAARDARPAEGVADEREHTRHPTPDRPRREIGVDQWVAQADERTRAAPRASRPDRARSGSVLPPAGKLALLTPAILVPFLPFVSEGNLFNYGIFILIYALLALGLNVVVGFAGLLDLGYVAFFGFGAYTYAFLSGTHHEQGPRLHAPLGRPVLDPRLRSLVCAVLGLFLGLVVAAPARRLPRDRDALLRPGLRRLHERHRPVRDHERLERARQRRPADFLRRPLHDQHDPRLLLVPARRAWPSCWSSSTASASRAPAAPGRPRARTRSPPR